MAGVQVEVRKLSVEPMDNNVYLLTETGSGAAVLIDAANEADRILAEVGDRDIAAIVTTHGHGDHWQALDAVADATGAPVYLHPDDAEMVPRRAEVPVVDLGRIRFGAAEVELLHTPGHTPGSTCVLLGDRHLFSGDTLFPGGPGNTATPQGDFPTIMHSLRIRLFALDDGTWVYPGHGDDTTIGAERPSLQDWEARGW
ncbi:MAG: MBL fold metallo-hydrolase [Nitriliruptorales bacterium]|nr:MBL fold metallo-hydrolase [Nitriliruptorales bacterium]